MKSSFSHSPQLIHSPSSISFPPKTYPKSTCSLHLYLPNSSTIILYLLNCNPSQSGLPASNLVTRFLQRLRIRLPIRGDRFYSWSGKIPHAVGQLSPRPTATEPEHPGDCAPRQGEPPSEKAAQHNSETPLLTTTRESPQAAPRPSTAKDD